MDIIKLNILLIHILTLKMFEAVMKYFLYLSGSGNDLKIGQ